jgi:adenylate cyclase
MNFPETRKWVLPLAAVLAAGLVVFTWGRWPQRVDSLSVPESAAGKPENARIYMGPANSIAVLPFKGDQDGLEPAYWSYGFARELHRLITRAPGLLVTSRNSSFFFRDPSIPQPIIAERLQVRFLLSGEMRVSDEQVRVSASLFDGKVKEEKWSRVFEGSLGDVFGIQDEILEETIQSVASGRQDGAPKSRPVSTQAWTNFLEGLYYQGQRTPAGYETAEQAFLAALELEPGYAIAQVGLAGLWLGKSAMGSGDAELVADAREALEAALRSEPDLPEALGLLSYIQRNLDWDWARALETAEQAVRLSPGDPDLMSTVSLAMFSLGQFQKAGDLLVASVRQDPLNLARRLRLGLLQEFAGQDEEALKSYRLIVGLNPDFPGVRAYRARVKIIQDKPESALKESEQEGDLFWRRYSKILAYTALGRDDEAQPLLDRMIVEDGGHSAYQVAEIMSFRGETDVAFAWLQRAHEQKDGGMSEVIGNYFLRNLHADPRWADILTLLGLPPAVPED